MAQVLFNHGISEIFNEITRSSGDEFYILKHQNYKELYDIDIEDAKKILLDNRMLYIGVVQESEFLINHNVIHKEADIVVLTTS